MGNWKFRLSDMMPNVWFYKLREMGKTRKHNTFHQSIKKKLPSSNKTSPKPQFFRSRPSSYYYHIPEPTRSVENLYNSPTNRKFSETQFHDFPRKSSSKRKTIYKPSPRLVTSSVTPNCSSSAESFTQSAPKKSRDPQSSYGSLQLPPILTKPKAASSKFVQYPTKILKDDSDKTQKESKTSPRIKKSLSYSTGVKLRAKSPRIGRNKLVQSCGRRNGPFVKRTRFSESLAIVKSSFDPQRDFRKSMVEMIVENNIVSSKDLEELLACYLSLNSDEHHDLIVKAFQEIWFDMARLWV